MYWYHQETRFINIGIWFVLLFIVSLSAYSETNAEYLQKKLNTIQTMQATFAQDVLAKKTEPVKSSGTMALSKPNKFFWKTVKPMSQLFIADGSHLWIYDEELEQVSVRRQGNKLTGAAAIFLSNENNNIAQDFRVEVVKKSGGDYFDLRAKHGHVSFSKISLFFVGQVIKQIDLYDDLGQHTRLLFTNVKLNSKVPSSLFKFIVPKGTDVVNQ